MDPEQPGPERPRRRSYDDSPPVTVGITPVPDDEPPSRESPEQPEPEPEGVPASATHIYPTLDEPSNHVLQYLFDSERYCGEWRRHWVHVVGWIAFGAIGTLLLGYVIGLVGENNDIVTVVLVAWAVLVAVVGWHLLDWYFDRFVLTNKRVLLVEGIVTRKVGMMPLARVTDMAYKQSGLGRVLNYGTFVLESAGQDQALREIKPLPNPNELYLLFCQEMYDPDGRQRALQQGGARPGTVNAGEGEGD
jgi:membrane protein YdbS with pleckstrin-like domain